MPITLWLKYSKDKLAWEHNHIQDGHVLGSKPQGHPTWKNGEWLKCFMLLINGKVEHLRE